MLSSQVDNLRKHAWRKWHGKIYIGDFHLNERRIPGDVAKKIMCPFSVQNDHGNCSSGSTGGLWAAISIAKRLGAISVYSRENITAR